MPPAPASGSPNAMKARRAARDPARPGDDCRGEPGQLTRDNAIVRCLLDIDKLSKRDRDALLARTIDAFIAMAKPLKVGYTSEVHRVDGALPFPENQPWCGSSMEPTQDHRGVVASLRTAISHRSSYHAFRGGVRRIDQPSCSSRHRFRSRATVVGTPPPSNQLRAAERSVRSYETAKQELTRANVA